MDALVSVFLFVKEAVGATSPQHWWLQLIRHIFRDLVKHDAFSKDTRSQDAPLTRLSGHLPNHVCCHDLPGFLVITKSRDGHLVLKGQIPLSRKTSKSFKPPGRPAPGICNVFAVGNAAVQFLRGREWVSCGICLPFLVLTAFLLCRFCNDEGVIEPSLSALQLLSRRQHLPGIIL